MHEECVAQFSVLCWSGVGSITRKAGGLNKGILQDVSKLMHTLTDSSDVGMKEGGGQFFSYLQFAYAFFNLNLMHTQPLS
jgi:hypothetical protein